MVSDHMLSMPSLSGNLKCAVVCTSTGSLDYYPEVNKRISVARLSLLLKEQTFRDGKDMKAEDFYQWMVDHPNILPKTEPPDLEELIELFLGLAKIGYEEVIAVTISSTLSKSFVLMQEAAALVAKKIRVYPFDSGITSLPEGLMALEAAKQLDKGRSVEEVISFLGFLRSRCQIFACVDNMDYLVKNGRVSAVGGFVANMIKLKPILGVSSNNMKVLDRVRTTDKALEAMVNMAVEYCRLQPTFSAYVLYCGNEALYRNVCEKFRQQMNFVPETYPLTPVVGAHLGPATIGIAVMNI